MAVQPQSDYFELADYLGVLRRRWLMILAFTLIGTVLAGAYYYVAPRSYAATVLIQVNALPTNANALGGRTAGPVNMDNEGQIVASATVASIAKAQLHSPLTVTNLLKEIHVAVPPNTTFLQVTCDASSAVQAERCANAFGRAYLYNRRTSTLDLIASGIKALNTQATQLETSIEQLRAKVGKGGLPAGSAARGIAELQLSAKLARLGTITAKINSATPLEADLASPRSTAVGLIVTPAVTPTAPVSPKKKLILPSGFAAGLILGLVFAFVLDWRRPRISSERDIARQVELPTVFRLGEAKGAAPGVFAPPRSRTGQLFTELAQYVGSALGDGHHVVLVTAATAGSGAMVAPNLAGALARTRGETVLICADPHSAVTPRTLGPAGGSSARAGGGDGRGFAELLAGTASLADVSRRTADLPMLRVITPGLDAAGAVYDMQHDKVQRIMRELRREVRYVVIDVPTPSTDADTFSVAEFADAAIVSVAAGTARPADLTDCVHRLERLRTAVLAAVLLSPGTDTRSAPSGRSGRSRRVAVFDEGALAYQPPADPQPPPYTSSDYPSSDYPPPARPSSDYPAPDYPDPDYPVSDYSSSDYPSSVRSQPYSEPSRAGQPYPSQSRRAGRDDAAASHPPVIRPVSRRTSSAGGSAGTGGSTGSNGGSRHAAPSRSSGAGAASAGSAGADDKAANATALPAFSSAWTPRSVSETWPLPSAAGLTDEAEEAGTSDPLGGN
jgi:capsular polysaccharide biosynthesis protein